MNHIYKILAFTGLFFSIYVQAVAAQNDAPDSSKYEDIDAMRTQVKDILSKHYSSVIQDAQLDIKVSRLDPRLKLAKCSESKNIKVNGNQTKTANISVRVSCNGESPWSIFVPARIDVLQEVVTATRDIYKGTILKADDLSLTVRNTSNLGFGYAKSTTGLIGNAVTRNISSGGVIRLNHVSEPIAITRGDKITLEAGNGGLSVATSAIAMSDGKVGEQIRVKNAQSKRVIEAFVVAPGRAVANL